MTASTTPCCARPLDTRCVWVGALLSLLLMLAPLFAHAQHSVVRQAEIALIDEGYVVNADIELELGARLTEALLHGVPLHFALEFQIERNRWYWFDDTVVSRSSHYRLSYHAITRSYRLSVGGLHQTFDSLEGALRAMQRVRMWHVVEPETLQTGVTYNAAIRLRHDTARLPRPFQISALGNREWSLGSEWMRWSFLAVGPAP